MLTVPRIYDELGVRTVIHAAGTKTTHGGTRMHAETLAAMRTAAEAFVDVVALNRQIGAYIAQVTGAEAGMVTSGAASGVVLSIAACMAGSDLAKVRQLPNPRGMPDAVVMQKIHRGAYSHMYTFSGAAIVEVGDMNDCAAAELDAAIDDRTAAVAFLLGPRVLRQGLGLPDVARIAHARGVPVIVDAAAMLPPKANLTRFIAEGADLVTFSGGKMIHGPQNTGILCGRRDLIDACFANASPQHAIGRPHKVSREDMVGLYVALKRFVATDEAALHRGYRQQLAPVVEVLRDAANVRVSIVHDDINYNVPVVAIEFTAGWRGPDGAAMARRMLAGNLPVFMQYFPSLGHLVVNPVSLQPGEAEIVGRRLREEIACAQGERPALATPDLTPRDRATAVAS